MDVPEVVAVEDNFFIGFLPSYGTFFVGHFNDSAGRFTIIKKAFYFDYPSVFSQFVNMVLYYRSLDNLN